MPIDASIYRNVFDPAEAQARQAQIRNLGQQNELGQLKMDEYKRGIEKQGRIRDLARAANGDYGALSKSLAGEGYLEEAATIDKHVREQQTAGIDQEAKKIANASKRLEFIANVTRGAVDQVSYEQAVMTLHDNGIDMSKAPAQYDPAQVKVFQDAVISQKDKFDMQLRERDAKLKGDQFAETKRHNRAAESTAAGNLKVSRDRLEHDKAGGGQKPPAGYRWKADGVTLEPIPGGPAVKESLGTQEERTAGGYALRMQEAEKIIGTVAEADKAAQKPGYIEQAAGNGVIANVSRNEERQKYRQAQEDWVRAKLRKESGAVIAAEEMDREIATYFPQIGDAPGVIKQKADARQVAMKAMGVAAGKAAPKTERSVKRTGVHDGRKVVEYSDGTIEYAD